jgi:hypothetical protein
MGEWMKPTTRDYWLKGAPADLLTRAKVKALSLDPPVSLKRVIIDLLTEWLGDPPSVPGNTRIFRPKDSKPVRKDVRTLDPADSKPVPKPVRKANAPKPSKPAPPPKTVDLGF